MSGLFTYTSTLLMTVIGDPSQNNWWGGSPRGPNTFPNGPGGAPALGEPLTLEALGRANDLMQYYKARIYWLGNEILAAKYGTTTPLELTPVEEEMWAREVAVLAYMVTRINELLGMPPVPLRRLAGSKAAAPLAQQAAAPPEQAPAPPAQQAAAPPAQQAAAPPEQAPAPPAQQRPALIEAFQAASTEERAQVLRMLLGGP
jgi:hypothetical protein